MLLKIWQQFLNTFMIAWYPKDNKSHPYILLPGVHESEVYNCLKTFYRLSLVLKHSDSATLYIGALGPCCKRGSVYTNLCSQREFHTEKHMCVRGRYLLPRDTRALIYYRPRM